MRVPFGVTPKLPTSSTSTSTNFRVANLESDGRVALQAIQLLQNQTTCSHANNSFSKQIPKSAVETSSAIQRVVPGSKTVTSTDKKGSPALERKVFNALDIENTYLRLGSNIYQSAKSFLRDPRNIFVLHTKKAHRIFFTDCTINRDDVSCFKKHLVVYCEIDEGYSDLLKINGGLIDVLAKPVLKLTLGLDAVEEEYVYRMSDKKNSKNIIVFTMNNPCVVSDTIRTRQFVQKRVELKLPVVKKRA